MRKCRQEGDIHKVGEAGSFTQLGLFSQSARDPRQDHRVGVGASGLKVAGSGECRGQGGRSGPGTHSA